MFMKLSIEFNVVIDHVRNLHLMLTNYLFCNKYLYYIV